MDAGDNLTNIIFNKNTIIIDRLGTVRASTVLATEWATGCLQTDSGLRLPLTRLVWEPAHWGPLSLRGQACCKTAIQAEAICRKEGMEIMYREVRVGWTEEKITRATAIHPVAILVMAAAGTLILAICANPNNWVPPARWVWCRPGPGHLLSWRIATC